jgi:hypothetical protein
MPIAGHRSITPPTEVRRLTDPKVSLYKTSTARIYNSSDDILQRNSTVHSLPSSSSTATAIRVESTFESRQTQRGKFGLLEHERPETNVEPMGLTGDFDETPAPSGKPSYASIVAKDEAQSSIASSTRSAGYRHALLKTSSAGPTFIEKDLPVPPILSRDTSGMSPKPKREGKKHAENAVSIPSRKSSSPFTQHHCPSPPMFSRGPSESRENLGPQSHSSELKRKPKQPDRVKDAGVCHPELPGHPELHANLSERGSNPSSGNSSEPQIFTGEVYRTLPGGGLSISTVEVTTRKHKGHGHDVKVRPAQDRHGNYQHTDTTGSHDHSTLSKVRSFDPGLGQDELPKEILLASPTLQSSGSIQEPSTIAASKVRPFAEAGAGLTFHKGHKYQSKVRPSREAQEEECLEVTHQNLPHEFYKASLAPHRHGSPSNLPISKVHPSGDELNPYLTAHGGHQHASKVRPLKDDPGDHIQTYPQYPNAKFVEYPTSERHQGERDCVPVSKIHAYAEGSAEMSRHGGHRNVSKIQPPLETSRNLINEKHDHAPGLQKYCDDPCVDLPDYKPHEKHDHVPELQQYCDDPCQSADEDERFSIGSDVSFQDHPRRASDGQILKRASRHRPTPVATDYKRTTQWLRDILKYPDTYTPKLTELPHRGRSERNLVDRDAGGSNQENVPASGNQRTTGGSTLSERRPSRIDLSLKKAVSDLERIINEAISIAGQVVDHTGLGSPCHAEVGEPTHAGALPREPSGRGGSMRDRVQDLSDLDNNDQDRRLGTARHASTILDSSVPRHCGIVDRDRTLLLLDQGSHRYIEESGSYMNSNLLRTCQIPDRGSSNQNVACHQPPKKLLDPEVCSLDGGAPVEVDVIDFSTQYQTGKKRSTGPGGFFNQRSTGTTAADTGAPDAENRGRRAHLRHDVSLRGRSHVSIRGEKGFSLSKSKKRMPIARDWSPIRKRFVATVACISTALIGVLLGIYAGLVPSIQYYILDNSHQTILGNVGCFLGMAIPTFFLWPLPLLHGRKPYILSSLALSMPLLFPQALAVSAQRMTYITEWRMLLLVCRWVMGFCLGFASMNFHSILTDLFGASLMSARPHQEIVDAYDVRRHGGGMGVWLGIWTWCWIGSLGVGFLAGATIIDSKPPAWGFYISIIIVAVVLVLNVLCPEVRRSAYRRSVAEVRSGTEVSRRVARGEVMMHRVKTGPRWWGEELYHGMLLSFEMLRQPGFLVMAVYAGWIYAQVVLIIVLLGSLTSRYYRLRSPYVGLMVGSVALGALVAIPFQKANLFSRSRVEQQDTNLMTLDKKVTWTSHLVRRTVFAVVLPLAGIGYAIVSTGPPMSLSAPVILAAAIGFLSCLAISECNGLIMETFDCSDLQPGMTGHSRGSSINSQKRTNYSAFPRVTAGLACCHTFAFVFAAGATALGGLTLRILGQRTGTGVVAGILFVLTMLLLIVLIRFKTVQIIPSSKTFEMEKWTKLRRESIKRRASMPPSAAKEPFQDDEAWRPILIGNPVGKTRRVNILELGSMTRWTEIRKKNKLVDEGAHFNRAALDMAADAFEAEVHENMSELMRKLSNRSHDSASRRSHRSHRSRDEKERPEQIEMETFGVTTNPGRVTPGHLTPVRRDDSSEVFVERECVMALAVRETDEDGLETNAKADIATVRDHGSHMLSSKVRPPLEGKGKGKAD